MQKEPKNPQIIREYWRVASNRYRAKKKVKEAQVLPAQASLTPNNPIKGAAHSDGNP